MTKPPAKPKPIPAKPKPKQPPGFTWRKAAVKLAACVVTVIKTDGKIGMGSGLVMTKDADGRTIVQRWDRDFIAALNYIGIEVHDRPAKKRV